MTGHLAVRFAVAVDRARLDSGPAAIRTSAAVPRSGSFAAVAAAGADSGSAAGLVRPGGAFALRCSRRASQRPGSSFPEPGSGSSAESGRFLPAAVTAAAVGLRRLAVAAAFAAPFAFAASPPAPSGSCRSSPPAGGSTRTASWPSRTCLLRLFSRTRPDCTCACRTWSTDRARGRSPGRVCAPGGSADPASPNGASLWCPAPAPQSSDSQGSSHRHRRHSPHFRLVAAADYRPD